MTDHNEEAADRIAMSRSSRNPNQPTPEVSFRFGLRSLLIFVTVVGVLCGLLIPAVRSVREAHDRSGCRLTLSNISFALRCYHDDFGCFPPPFVADSAGKPMHSWRLLITPNMSGFDFYTQYDLSQPWNSPKNLALAKVHPSQGDNFRCPVTADARKLGETNYMMVVGSGTALPSGQPAVCESAAEESDDAILVVEVADSGVFWTEPRDLNLDEMSFRVNDKERPSISSHHVRGAMVLFADGRVELLDESTSPEELRELLTGAASKQPD